MTCRKTPAYSSQHEARIKCRNMGNRFRTYFCTDHGGWHVTKQVTTDEMPVKYRSETRRRKRFDDDE